MKTDDFNARMRSFEAAQDLAVLPGVFIIARLDGRSFTRLTKELYPFEAPFDPVFRDHMIATAKHLMAGIGGVYAYTQSDEISLLFDADDNLFDRKMRKLQSILAGEASACFALSLGGIASFDCRISQLPSEELVIDYFRWRQADATRNALNAHSYWMLRRRGLSARESSSRLAAKTTSQKSELLLESGIDFAVIPSWQKRGVGVFREDVEKVGKNPKTGELTSSVRRQIRVELELPTQSVYDNFLRTRIAYGRKPSR